MKKKAKTTLQGKNRKLAREWHPTRNAPLTPKDISPGSRAKVWWRCGKGHEWEASVGKRSEGTGCPYCAGRKACQDNCLKTVNPALARQWHPTKNGPLTPKDVLPGSGKKAWWKCKKGHEWKAVIGSRSKGTACPYCTGQKVCGDNSLQAVNPVLAREWHPAKNGRLGPGDITPGSNRKAWWRCQKKHEWKAQVSSRNRGRGCPYCAGVQISEDNNLQAKNPALARQWHPAKNVPLTPKDVTPGTDRKVWWKCGKGHEWKAQVTSRNRGTGCPSCRTRKQKVSKEKSLQAVNPVLAREWHPAKNAPLTPVEMTPYSSKKVWWKCKKGHEWKAVINNRNRGRGCPSCRGRKVAEDNNLQAVNPGLAREWHPAKNAPLTPKDVTPGTDRKVWWKCGKGHEWEAQINSRTYGAGCPHCARTSRRVTEENNLWAVSPWLAREWHRGKNASMTMKDVSPYSNRKVWWKCRKGHEWEAKICGRSLGAGCPYCAGKRACKDNCLQTMDPKLARQWHREKNAPLTAKDVIAGSHKKAWWMCKKGHEWEAALRNRSKNGTGCPYCSGRKPTRETSLKTVSPRLAREWHPARNAPLTPLDVFVTSGRRVWWKCREGHEWRQSVHERFRGIGCPVCIVKLRRE